MDPYGVLVKKQFHPWVADKKHYYPFEDVSPFINIKTPVVLDARSWQRMRDNLRSIIR